MIRTPDDPTQILGGEEAQDTEERGVSPARSVAQTDTENEDGTLDTIVALEAANPNDTPDTDEVPDTDTPKNDTPSSGNSFADVDFVGILKSAIKNIGFFFDGLISSVTGDGSRARVIRAAWGPHQGETLVNEWDKANPQDIVFRRQENQYYSQNEKRFLTDDEVEELDLPDMDKASSNGRMAFRDAAEGKHRVQTPDAPAADSTVDHDVGAEDLNTDAGLPSGTRHG